MRKSSKLSPEQLSKLGITSVNGLIHFGGKPIFDTDYNADESGIPIWYVVRVKRTTVIAGESDTFLQYVTGLDISDSKCMLWLGAGFVKYNKSLSSAFYNDFGEIANVLDNLYEETAGQEWIICLEEEGICEIL